MKLATLRDKLASHGRATGLLVLLLITALLSNLVLATQVARLAGRERIVLTPPTIHKSFWIEADRVSPEYLEQMGYFLMQLTLNVTPHSVEHQSKVLLAYAAPSVYGELRTTLAATAERIKRDSTATVFSPQDLMVDERALRVAMRGTLTTYVSDRRVAETVKAYLIEFQYSAGRIFLKSFRETKPHDPLETHSPAPVAGA